MMKLLLLLLATFVFSACEKGDEDRLAQAQACLDRSNQSNVSECELIVAGIDSPKASLIRCSANFISQGFTGTRFANAFTALKTTSSGQNSTLNMMAYMVFTQGADDDARKTAANTAVYNCTQSGLSGMTMFANFAKAATLLAADGGIAITPGTVPTAAEMQAALAGYSGSDADLGATVKSISGIYCGTDTSTKDANFCAMVNDAAAQGSDAAIGARIKALLAQNS